MDRKAGFTLVEIMIVVAIIGILAMLAIPAFAKARRQARQIAFANDLRIFTDAAEMYMIENVAPLSDGNTGDLPPEWAPYVRDQQWTGLTPIGGRWDTERDWGITFAIGVVGPNADMAEMEEIDARVDDGDLCTGAFRQLVAGRYYYILEE